MDNDNLRWSRAKRHLVGMVAVIGLAILAACSALPPQQPLFDAAEPVTSPGWIRLRPEANEPPREFFFRHAHELQLAEGTEMAVTREETDELGIVHLRFQQRWRGLEVEGAEFLVHARGERTLSANGRLAFDFAPVTAPAVDETQAWAAACRTAATDRYYDNRRLQASVTEGPTGTPPRGTLLYASLPGPEPRWGLAWRFDVYTVPMERSLRIYVDAQSGAVLKTQPLLPSCFTTNGATTFRGAQPFNTQQRGDRFALTDDCHGTLLRYRDPDSTGTKVVDLLDNDNVWTDQDIAKVTSFWALGVTYDYFDLVHKRKGHDGKNAEITLVNQPTLGDNANGGSGFINIGLGSTGAPGDDYNTADIVGHEFTHNVIETSAALGYDASKESAALNESFSDILGTMVDAWEKRTQTPNWIIGFDKGCAGGAICRNLINPKQFANPDTYKGLNWQAAGGIDPHNNGSVQNRWFALAASGGSGTNAETGYAYNITGIGIEKARRIAYRALTRYLVSSADFIAARDASIQATVDLFGNGSVEENTVTQAWCVVNLCPWTVPKLPDRFDRPGGNPNPVSPDQNNTEAGATPINSMQWAVLGGPRPKPKLSIANLSIFPADDVDHFSINVPTVSLLGGACFPTRVAMSFTAPVNARLLVDGRTVAYAHDTQYLQVPASGTFVLQVSAPFPGLILDYAIRASFYQTVDPHCWQTEPPSVFERIQQCPMCDVRVLGRGEEVILNPDVRQPDLVAPPQHVFRFRGGRLSMPVTVADGRALQVDLVDADGRVVQQAQWSAGAAAPVLRAELPEGIYALRFSGYGNGTKVQVGAPR